MHTGYCWKTSPGLSSDPAVCKKLDNKVEVMPKNNTVLVVISCKIILIKSLHRYCSECGKLYHSPKHKTGIGEM